MSVLSLWSSTSRECAREVPEDSLHHSGWVVALCASVACRMISGLSVGSRQKLDSGLVCVSSAPEDVIHFLAHAKLLSIYGGVV